MVGLEWDQGQQNVNVKCPDNAEKLQPAKTRKTKGKRREVEQEHQLLILNNESRWMSFKTGPFKTGSISLSADRGDLRDLEVAEHRCGNKAATNQC